MKLLRGSIYRSILLIFTTILLLVGIFCSLIYIQGVSLIEEEITQLVHEQNKNMTRNLQDQYRQLRLMQYQFVDFNQITELILANAREETVQELDAVSQIQDGLLTIWRGNSLVEEVSVVVPDVDLVIRTGSNLPLDAKDKSLVAVCQEFPSGTLMEYGDKIIIFSDERAPLYYAYLELDKTSLISLLGERNQEKAGNNILYNKRNGTFLGKEIPEGIKEIIPNHIKDSQNVAEEAGYLFTVAEVNNTDYYCVTFAERGSIYGSMELYRIFYIILLVLLFVSGIWFWRKMFDMVHRPMHVLVTSLDTVSKGNLKEQITYPRNDEFQYIYDSFNNMTSRLDQLVDKNARQEILLQKAQLKQLQAQISPHFFYNSFITLSNRIQEEDYEFAAEFSRELGQYFMFVTRSGREYIPLKEELEHATTYMNIQEIRFRNRITMEVEHLQESYQRILVPRLILQPVIENVFKYVVEKTREEIRLRVGFEEDGNRLLIVIENSGELDDEVLERMEQQLGEVEGEIHALANIHQRLGLVYPGCGALHFEKSRLGGLKVVVRIPMEEM